MTLDETYNQLIGRSRIVRFETTEFANTAERIGSLFEDMLSFVYQAVKSRPDGFPAAQILPWPAENPVSANWISLPTEPRWESVSDYPDMFNNLGGVSSPWGYNASTQKFCFPYCPEGHSLIKKGASYVLSQQYGDFNSISKHEHPISESETQWWEVEPSSGGSGLFALIKKKTQANGGNTSEAGINNGNLSPCIAFNYILKLYNDNTTQYEAYQSLPIITIPETTDIPIPAGMQIKDINIFVVSGNPTVNIPVLATGDMNGNSIYPITANLNFTTAGNIQVQISGSGTVKVQIIKFNI